MQIPQGVTTNKMISLEPYLQVTIKNGDEISNLKKNTKRVYFSYFFFKMIFLFTTTFDNNIFNCFYKDFMFAKRKSCYGLLTVNATFNDKKSVRLPGLRGQLGVPKELKFDKYTVILQYGSRFVDLPFF